MWQKKPWQLAWTTSNIPSYVKNINNKSEFISKQRYYPANTFCFPRRVRKTSSSRRLQDVLKTFTWRRLEIMCWRRLLEDVLEDKKCYIQDVFSTSSPRWMFAGYKYSNSWNKWYLPTYLFTQQTNVLS